MRIVFFFQSIYLIADFSNFRPANYILAELKMFQPEKFFCHAAHMV